MMMVKFHSSNITSPETAAYAYPAIGSKDQIIAGAVVKSKQHPNLRGREWIVVFTNYENRTEFTRSICDGEII